MKGRKWEREGAPEVKSQALVFVLAVWGVSGRGRTAAMPSFLPSLCIGQDCFGVRVNDYLRLVVVVGNVKRRGRREQERKSERVRV
jgi:hypothetical protein